MQLQAVALQMSEACLRVSIPPWHIEPFPRVSMRQYFEHLKELKVHERNDGLCTGFHVRKNFPLSTCAYSRSMVMDMFLSSIAAVFRDLLVTHTTNSNDPCGHSAAAASLSLHSCSSRPPPRPSRSFDFSSCRDISEVAARREVNKSRTDHQHICRYSLCSSVGVGLRHDRLCLRDMIEFWRLNTTYSTLRARVLWDHQRKFTGLKRHDQIHRLLRPRKSLRSDRLRN